MKSFKQKGEATFEILFNVVAIAVCLVIAYFIGGWSCSSRWEGSGYKSDYGFVAGCRIYKDGKWIPEKSFREVN